MGPGGGTRPDGAAPPSCPLRAGTRRAHHRPPPRNTVGRCRWRRAIGREPSLSARGSVGLIGRRRATGWATATG
jgi:hypothetical protein